MKTVSVSINYVATAAIIAALSLSTAAFAGTTKSEPVAPTAQVNGVAVPVAHQGPGAGSVKTPPFAWLAKAPKDAAESLVYHVVAQAPVVRDVHQGPGLGSVKSPGAF